MAVGSSRVESKNPVFSDVKGIFDIKTSYVTGQDYWDKWSLLSSKVLCDFVFTKHNRQIFFFDSFTFLKKLNHLYKKISKSKNCVKVNIPLKLHSGLKKIRKFIVSNKVKLSINNQDTKFWKKKIWKKIQIQIIENEIIF